jgi:lysophospholipase L1-like esterase
LARILELILGQLLLLLVVLGAAGLSAEWVARQRFPELRYAAERQQRPEDLFVQFDARYGWSNRPGADVRFQRRDFDTHVRINDQGFRGPVFGKNDGSGFAPGSDPGAGRASTSGTGSAADPTGSPAIPDTATGSAAGHGASRGAGPVTAPRIAILGDSYVFGHGVEEDETFAALLRKRWPSAEVGNFGVIGYSTDQELLLLKDTVLPLDPDLVVLCLYRNDVLDNGQATAWGLYRKPRFVRAADGTLVLESDRLDARLPFSMRLRRDLRRHFVLYDVLAFRIAGLRAGSGETGVGDSEGLTRDLLLEATSLCHAQNVPFLLVVLPGFEDARFLDDVPPKDAGARLDLAPVFSRYAAEHPDSALGFTYDSHWNPRGHRLVADAIATEVEERGWLRDAVSETGTDEDVSGSSKVVAGEPFSDRTPADPSVPENTHRGGGTH